MTQKTNAFSQSQKPKWADGQLANGSNFAQLIDAIALLVDETATETLTQAAANATSAAVGDDHIKQIAKAILDTAADYNTTDIWAKLTERINGKVSNADVINQIKTSLNDPATYQALGVYTAITNQFPSLRFSYDRDAKTKVDQAITTATADLRNRDYTYTYDGSRLKISKGTQEVKNVQPVGNNFLVNVSKAYKADQIATDVYVLTRPDGARVVYDAGTNTAKPAAVLIG